MNTKTIKTIFAALLLLASAQANAGQEEESRIESQALACASMAFIHTSLSDAEPAFGEAMTEVGQMFSSIYAFQIKHRTSKSITNGYVNEHKSAFLDALKEKWSTEPNIVIYLAALCDDWRASIAASIKSKKPDELTPEYLLQVASKVPVTVSPEEVAKWREITPQAFTAWASLGGLTPKSFEELVKELSKEAPKAPKGPRR